MDGIKPSSYGCTVAAKLFARDKQQRLGPTANVQAITNFFFFFFFELSLSFFSFYFEIKVRSDVTLIRTDITCISSSIDIPVLLFDGRSTIEWHPMNEIERKLHPLSRVLAVGSRKICDLFTFDRAMILPEWDYPWISCRHEVKRVLDRSVELFTKDERSVKWHVSHGNRTSLPFIPLPYPFAFGSFPLSLSSRTAQYLAGDIPVFIK